MPPSSPPAPSGGADGAAGAGHGHRGPGWRRSLLAPVAAAVTVVAVAVALVLVKDAPTGSLAAPPPAASASPAAPAGLTTTQGRVAVGVPGYYVARMPADRPYLVVGDTFTGKTIATVKAPGNVVLGAVYGGAADDRTFIVTGNVPRGAHAGTVWYLLRLAAGRSTPARLTPLPVPVRQAPAGAALSPDGTKVAVAMAGSPATLRVYSAATGALLRQWTATASGELTAEKARPGSRQFTGTVLRWSPDGRQLAFAWNAAAIRVLDAAAPDGNLITRSRPLAAIGTTYATLSSFTCRAAHGWQFITVAAGSAAGQGVVCAGSTLAGRYTACGSPPDQKCTYTQLNSIGFLRATEDSGGDSFLGLEAGSACPALAQPGNGAYLGWANADGSEVIGSQVCAGRSRFGIFRGTTFTPLPALPVSLPVPTVVMDGTVAW